jgi:molecular chaperone DnaK
MKPVNFGIDLGTTNSLIAKYENGKVHVFKNPIGHKETLASVVAYRPERILVGDKAREYLTKDPINVFGSFKRKMGTDEKYYVVNIDDNVTPLQLSSLVLKELKTFIHGDEIPEACVITIPASFDTMQSNATLKAGQLAGFKEIFLLQEPIAASLAFFNENSSIINKNGYWLVYDFGGGTFDAALVHSSDHGLKILDHAGNNFLGGVDFDFAIVDKLIVPEIIRKTGLTNFEQEFRVKFGKYEKLFYEVMYFAEEAKKEMSISEKSTIEFSAEIGNKVYEFSIPITKEVAAPIFQPIIDETIKLLSNVIQTNHLAAKDINQIILVGGSTFIPQVREQLSVQTGISLNQSVDPTTAIAVGAAYYASNKLYNSTNTYNSFQEVEGIISTEDNSALLSKSSTQDFRITTSYSKSSRDLEEVLAIFCDGDYDEKFYRIIRNGGGFDTGYVPLKSKKTEFLPLLPSVINSFILSIYNKNYEEIKNTGDTITINQGKYTIDGQLLPHDITIEVDDLENQTTRLEVIFERNSLLPQKRTLYREISKTLNKGSKDSIIINILEGDKNARPLSNLTIGCIEIAGKDLKIDLIKGSDIEIQLEISDSRILKTKVFLVMSQQEFKNVFLLSEKHINLERLKEQFDLLEDELAQTVKKFQYNQDEIWEIKGQALLDELLSMKEKLFKLKQTDKSDEKYIIAEKIMRISQYADKLGGNERIAKLLEEYWLIKERAQSMIKLADFEKDDLLKSFSKIIQSEDSYIRSKNVSFIEGKIQQLNDLKLNAQANSKSFLIVWFLQIKDMPPELFSNYNAAKSIIKLANISMEKESYSEFRQHIYRLSSLLSSEKSDIIKGFKGTGIG